MIGESLGPYKIIELLGVGGMGEVYLGEDTRLGRKVAIKVLPPEFASDPERLARFEQEARAAAALNHPHIAVVYDVGAEAGDDGPTTHFIVQEYLEGQTLRERLDKGGLPLAEALDLATEACEALAAAHKAGIVHRDLKPANVFVTRDGHAKILDFGLAKLTEAARISAGSDADSRSPTMLGTVAGQVMGTAGYMAPEQVEGEADIDQRADLFAFGCLLFEMATGRQAFSGKNVLDTLHRIANSDPALLRDADPSLPADLQRILDKCLAKRRADRCQHADDLVVDLRVVSRNVENGTAISVADASTAPVAASADRRGLSAPAVAGIVAIVAVVSAVATLSWVGLGGEPQSRPLQTFTIQISDVVDRNRTSLAISPDGRHIAYVADVGNGDQIYRRPLEQLAAVAIPGTEAGRQMFFSPAGAWLGFRRGSELFKVSLAGGEPFRLCGCEPNGTPSWSNDGFVYFATDEGIGKVPDVGGDVEIVLAVEGAATGYTNFASASLLPAGRGLLFTATRQDRSDRVVVAYDLEAGQFIEIATDAAQPRYALSGHVVYGRDDTLFAVAFDADRLEVTGRAAPVVQSVSSGRFRALAARFSDTGILVYHQSRGRGNDDELAWVARDGSWETIPGSAKSGVFWTPRLSPDGSQAAVTIDDDPDPAIWLFDIERGVWEPFESEGTNLMPLWSPNGGWIYFSSRRDGSAKLYRRQSNRQAAAEVVSTQIDDFRVGTDVSPDGEWILVTTAGGDVLAVPVEGGEPVVIAQTPAREDQATFSPDGNWVTYRTLESGEAEVVVRPFPGPGGIQQASSAGGEMPRFSPSGGELYYRGGAGGLFVVDVTPGERLRLGSPRALLAGGVPSQQNGPSYSTIAGERFLMATRLLGATSGDPTRDELVVMLNWFEQLKRLVPTGR